MLVYVIVILYQDVLKPLNLYFLYKSLFFKSPKFCSVCILLLREEHIIFVVSEIYIPISQVVEKEESREEVEI